MDCKSYDEVLAITLTNSRHFVFISMVTTVALGASQAIFRMYTHIVGFVFLCVLVFFMSKLAAHAQKHATQTGCH